LADCIKDAIQSSFRFYFAALSPVRFHGDEVWSSGKLAADVLDCLQSYRNCNALPARLLPYEIKVCVLSRRGPGRVLQLSVKLE
jgi:hypothetical protein